MTRNNPFSRVSRRPQQVYRSTRVRLRQADIDDSAALRRAHRGVVRTALPTLAIIALAAIALPTLAPRPADPWLPVTTLFALWLGIHLLQSHVHLRRYLQEACRGPDV